MKTNEYTIMLNDMHKSQVKENEFSEILKSQCHQVFESWPGEAFW